MDDIYMVEVNREVVGIFMDYMDAKDRALDERESSANLVAIVICSPYKIGGDRVYYEPEERIYI